MVGQPTKPIEIRRKIQNLGGIGNIRDNLVGTSHCKIVFLEPY